jgi:hypothetical protein
VTDGKANNPVVHELNANWDRQKARAHVLLIAGEGTSTLSGPNTLTIKGDGVVPEKSVELPGVPIKDVWWTTHTSVKDSPDSLLAAANFITGAPVSFSGSADPTDVAPDRDIVPIQITATADQVQYLIKDKT